MEERAFAVDELHIARRRQKARKDLSAFGPLIDNPHDFGAVTAAGAEFPLLLPSRGRIAVSMSVPVQEGEIEILPGSTRSAFTTDLAATIRSRGIFAETEKNLDIKVAGPTGNLFVWVIDGFSEAHLIGAGVVA